MSAFHERVLFPFSAIVGQDKMKTALILNAINPTIGCIVNEGSLEERLTDYRREWISVDALAFFPRHPIIMPFFV